MREISWLAEDLLASQEGLCSMELVSWLLLLLFLLDYSEASRSSETSVKYLPVPNTLIFINTAARTSTRGFILPHFARFYRHSRTVTTGRTIFVPYHFCCCSVTSDSLDPWKLWMKSMPAYGAVFDQLIALSIAWRHITTYAAAVKASSFYFENLSKL
jgi:hypothetical protein